MKWQQPSGPTLVEPIWCRDCEYDSDGSKTKAGQVMDGKFYGERIRLVRDGNGNVTDRYAYNSTTGELNRHDVMGPYGWTEQRAYLAGKLHSHSTLCYDQYGRPSEWHYFDAHGSPQGYSTNVSAKDGDIAQTIRLCE